MEKLEIKKVPFLGTELMAAKDSTGQIWAGVRWMCDGMELSRGQRDRQIANIQSDKVVSKGASNLRLPTNGGTQDVICLKLDFIPLWLAKISITPAMEAETPELAATLEEYQLRAKDVLAEAFLEKVPDSYTRKSTSVGEVASLLKILRSTMVDNEQPPEVISNMVKTVCGQFGVELPNNFVKVDPFKQFALVGMFWPGQDSRK